MRGIRVPEGTQDPAEHQKGFFLSREEAKTDPGPFPDPFLEDKAIPGLPQDPGPRGKDLFNIFPLQEFPERLEGPDRSFHRGFVEFLGG
jgi:hypothetical protein